MKANFNELKSEIMSYGVHSRVSNSGDTFRLHAVTFVKITIAGNSIFYSSESEIEPSELDLDVACNSEPSIPSDKEIEI